MHLAGQGVGVVARAVLLRGFAEEGNCAIRLVRDIHEGRLSWFPLGIRGTSVQMEKQAARTTDHHACTCMSQSSYQRKAGSQ